MLRDEIPSMKPVLPPLAIAKVKDVRFLYVLTTKDLSHLSFYSDRNSANYGRSEIYRLHTSFPALSGRWPIMKRPNFAAGKQRLTAHLFTRRRTVARRSCQAVRAHRQTPKRLWPMNKVPPSKAPRKRDCFCIDCFRRSWVMRRNNCSWPFFSLRKNYGETI